MLKGKTAIIYGGGGAVGGAVARAFAGEGARLFIAGRSLAKLEKVADDISAAGGTAEIAELDVMDEEAVKAHADDVAAKMGGIDIALNAVGLFHVQGKGFAHLSLDDFAFPITAYAQMNFITAKAVAWHMAKRRSGVILTLSTPGGRLPGTGYLGFGTACAAVEGFSRLLACELAPSGIRVICLRPHALPEALALQSHARAVFQPAAAQAGISVDEMLAGPAETLLKRYPTLAEVAQTAAFMASDKAGAMTGTIANLTCGALVD
ncbi:SDR family oxidoreductase [Nordella sp. HKS 07]|uniref:SDR family NAD(P)-dependent oxidoreductase n=1 Tax=Nordella sp. HKS 07 TaxID=2712222 RepID=UPI0013E15994|nr:SDR family oxidoreductase [Nordella sp. HKS 07]QIG47315.1 SDR family oxidoreductase [Nordella sp. HKS 07]